VARVALYASSREVTARMTPWTLGTSAGAVGTSTVDLANPSGPDERAGEFEEVVDAEARAAAVEARGGGGRRGGGSGGGGVRKSVGGIFAAIGHGRRLLEYGEDGSADPIPGSGASNAAEAAAAKRSRALSPAQEPGATLPPSSRRVPVAAAIIDGCCDDVGCGQNLPFGAAVYQEFRFPPEGHLPPDRYVVEIVGREGG
jgi:hypothetical protein